MRHKSFKANAVPRQARSPRYDRRMVVSAYASVMPSVAYGASPIFRRVWGWQRTSLARGLKKLVSVLESWNRCRLRTAVAYREYAPNPKRPRVVPGHSLLLRQWGESYLFSRGEKRLQVLDKTHRESPFRVQVHNAKGEILTANDLELVTVKTERTFTAATRGVGCMFLSRSPRRLFWPAFGIMQRRMQYHECRWRLEPDSEFSVYCRQGARVYYLPFGWWHHDFLTRARSF